MKIIAAIIGMGIGQKHLEAIENYKKSLELNPYNVSSLKQLKKLEN